MLDEVSKKSNDVTLPIIFSVTGHPYYKLV